MTPLISMLPHSPTFRLLARPLLVSFRLYEHPDCSQKYGRLRNKDTRSIRQTQLGTRLSPANFPKPVNVDIDVYYLLRLGDERGSLMGGVSIAQRGSNIPPEMGWCLLEEFHGKGYATEAEKELLRMLREELGIKEIIAWPRPQNLPSVKVAKRVGFVEGGKAKDESGVRQMVYVLPGMLFDTNVILRAYGE